jgi:hypothetical protein
VPERDIAHSTLKHKDYTVLVEVGAKGKTDKASAAEEGHEEEGGQRRYEQELSM